MGDLRKTALSYLVVEFLLESVPQIIIQSINNTQKAEWTNNAIFSVVFSAFVIVATAWKHGCHRFADHGAIKRNVTRQLCAHIADL